MGKFKVGDRVRLTEDNCGFGAAGDTGEIVDPDGGSEDCVIRFDNKVNGAREWFVGWRGLELIPAAAVAPQPQPPAQAVTIREGGYYRTRDGRKVGPAETNWGNDEYPWSVDGFSYTSDGKWLSGEQEDDIDLIAEWVDGPAGIADAVVKQMDELQDWMEGKDPASVTAAARAIAASNDNGSAPATEERALLKTKQGYAYEIARFGDYVWLDVGKKAPLTLRVTDIAA